MQPPSLTGSPHTPSPGTASCLTAWAAQTFHHPSLQVRDELVPTRVTKPSLEEKGTNTEEKEKLSFSLKEKYRNSIRF